MVLGFSEMLKEDRPDEEIWLDEPRLVEHFKAREAARDAERTEKDDDDWSPGSMVSNALADDLLREVGARG